jgi:hypothetical protein
MTAQTPDIIILDGKAFRLYSSPLERYFRRIKWRPTILRRCTANRRGYVARWEIFGERLFLTGLFGQDWSVPPHLHSKLAPDPDPFEPDEVDVKSLRLQDLFPDQAPLVFAEWVTERLVVPTGPRLVYVHAGFGSQYATYRTIKVVKGRVRSVRDWDGRDWAREIGHDWLVDKVPTGQELFWPEQTSVGAELTPNDEPVNWRELDDPGDRKFAYEIAQIDALLKPCGQTPADEPSPSSATRVPRRSRTSASPHSFAGSVRR